MGFIILAFLLSVPALLFSMLAWRLKTSVFFWLGVIFAGLMLILYIYEVKFLVSFFATIDTMFWGLFFVALLGLPVFFLIASKSPKSPDHGESGLTDDYLNSIINEKDEEIDYE